MIIRSRWSSPMVLSDPLIAWTAFSWDFTSAIDVAIADLRGRLHGGGGVGVVDEPGPESELRDLDAVRQRVGLVQDHDVGSVSQSAGPFCVWMLFRVICIGSSLFPSCGGLERDPAHAVG